MYHFDLILRPGKTFPALTSDESFVEWYFAEGYKSPLREKIPTRIIDWMEGSEWELDHSWGPEPFQYTEIMTPKKMLSLLYLIQREFGYIPSRSLLSVGWKANGLNDGSRQVKIALDRGNKKSFTSVPKLHGVYKDTILSVLYFCYVYNVDLEQGYRLGLTCLGPTKNRGAIHPAHRASSISFSFGSEWCHFFMAAVATPLDFDAAIEKFSAVAGSYTWEEVDYAQVLSEAKARGLERRENGGN
jgi:hypothetical protein